MKRIGYIILLISLAFSVTSCKSKKKISETFKETNLHVCSENMTENHHDDRMEYKNTAELVMRTTETDSLVEKFWERIVVDSCGRILLHDKEHVREGYKGKSNVREKQCEDSKLSMKVQTDISQQKNFDSSKTTDRKDMTETAKPTYQWLWYLGLFILLLFISRLT